MDEKKMTVRDGVYRIAAASFFVGKMAVFSVTGVLATFLLFWFPRRYHPLLDYWQVNTAENEPVIFKRPCFSKLQLASIFVNWDIPFFFYNFVCFTVYATTSRRKKFIVFLTTCIGVVAFYLTRFSLNSVASLFPYLGTCAGIMIVSPKGSTMPRYAVFIVFQFILSLFVLYAWQKASMDTNDSMRLLLITVFFPIVKEVISIVTRHVSKELTLNPSVDQSRNVEDDFAVNREMTWGFFMFFQIVSAFLFRMAVADASTSYTVLALVTILQSVIEVITRLTTMYRDEMIERFFSRCSRKSDAGSSKRSALVAPSELTSSIGPPSERHRTSNSSQRNTAVSKQLIKDQKLRLKAFKSFHGRLVCGDMIAEFMAIFTAPWLIYLFQDRKLYMPLDYYRSDPKAFDSGSTRDLPMLLIGFALQLGMEVFTDTLCVMIETRGGIDLELAWQNRPKHFWYYFVWIAWYATVLFYTFVWFNDSFPEQCWGRDMCWCFNSLHSMRRDYCKRLYPLSGGFPTNDTLTPICPLFP